MTVNPTIRPALIFGAWAAWVFCFVYHRRRKPDAVARVEKTARWGVVLEAIGYFLVYAHSPAAWKQPLAPWRLGLGLGLAAIAILLAWGAMRALGRQWRIDAGLNADHELIRHGPYRIVRHPIYASMLCMLLMGIAWIGTLPGWPIGLAIFLAGTEIRVRIEDGLLRKRFGETFEGWRRSVPAYIPFMFHV